MKNTLEARMKSNLNVVSVLFVIASIFSIIRIVSLINAQTFQISELFTNKDYIPILIQGYGIIAFFVSIQTNNFINRLTDKQQVIYFCIIGMTFMPYTIILYVIGIMSLINDNRLRIHFYTSSLIGMILFGFAVYFIFV